jgi:hypothetical protein
MKKIFLIACLLFDTLWSFACAVCERTQPKLLRGITHGAGPESKWDYVIVWVAIVIVAAALLFSVKWLVRPGERSGSHIKRFILNNE